MMMIIIACLIMLLAPLHAAAQETPATSLWQEALGNIEMNNYQAAAPLLDDLHRREGFSMAHEAHFLLGVALYRQKQWQKAADILGAAATQVPPLGDYALYYVASAYQALGQNAQALAMLSRLLYEHPESLLAEKARQERARLYLTAGQLTHAEEAYRDYLSRTSNEARRREALLALAEIAVKTDRRTESEALLRELWLKQPGTREAARAGELLASITEAPPFTIDEQFERALNLYRNGQHSLAITAFTPFLDENVYPVGGTQDRFASRARLWTGISHFQRRDYSLAVSLLGSIGQDHSIYSAEALYWIGRSYARVDDREKAIMTWTRLIDTYPDSPFTAESLYLMALQHNDNGQPKRAVQALNRLIRSYESSRFINAALWTRAWIHYRQSAFKQALPDLQRLHTRSTSDLRFQVQALYWQGRTLESLKRRKQAIEAYTRLLNIYSDDDYYAEQTRRRLGALDRKTAQAPLPVARREAGAPSPCTLSREPCAAHTAKARLLKELRLREEASEEFRALAGRYADDRGVLYEACSALLDLGSLEKGVWIAKRLLRPLYAQTRPTEPIPRYWECLYPLGYWGLVQEQSTRHALDPYLVEALIREESAFGERVVSTSGAVGLMQLLPSTANGLVNDAGRPAEPVKLDQPPTNIALGTRYLAMMISDFKGNWAKALAAYNAGPNQVRRWLERWGDRVDEEFIEEIPFTETRAYVKRVLGSYYRYRMQYSKQRTG